MRPLPNRSFHDLLLTILQGYVYQLDGRELLVRSINIFGRNEERTYRITEQEYFQINEALMFGV